MASYLKRTFSATRREGREPVPTAAASSSQASNEVSSSDAAPQDEDAEGTMNRENVSNKIAAGMDRWQNTLEDMINLRSSNNTVFKDYYWAQNGFDELRRPVRETGKRLQ